MRDIRERRSDSSDNDVSLDSGIFIPRRRSPDITPKARAKKAAQNSADEIHWRNANLQHSKSGIPSQPKSLVRDDVLGPC